MIPEILKSYPKLYHWVSECVKLTEPQSVYVFLDPIEDDKHFTKQLLDTSVLKKINRPHSFYIATDPRDTARVEECTFICSNQQAEAGATNNWQDPDVMKKHLKELFTGCMRGREMIIIPYCMGPLDSDYKILGVEITDSPYVAISMRRMARVGMDALELLNNSEFVPGLHSVGYPLEPLQNDIAWPCNPEKRVIAHFPSTHEIFSYGSGYGGNALLGKKCLALRIASYLGLKRGFLAEHMLIMGLENPKGEKKYILAAFPSACGKTNLAMLESQMPGWKITCIGDDIAWIHVDKHGDFRAINPEWGFFGVAPGTSWSSNPEAMRIMQKDTLFTNTGYTLSGDVYWEGMGPHPSDLMTWTHKKYDGHEKAAHPNSRFTSPLENCTRLDEAYNDPRGVKIDAIIFGGRRSDTLPLVAKSFDYQHGIFMGASLSSETTAASVGEVGKVRLDPFAMLPFCGYNMADYFAHWLSFEKISNPPQIFRVNWFKKSQEGEFLWPGFSENLRVLKWVFDACDHKVTLKKSPWGFLPIASEFDLSGIDVDFEALFESSMSQIELEKKRVADFFKFLGPSVPQCLWQFV